MVGAFVGLEVRLEVVGDDRRRTVVGAKVRLVVGRHCNLECNHGENVHAFAIRTLLACCVSCHTMLARCVSCRVSLAATHTAVPHLLMAERNSLI